MLRYTLLQPISHETELLLLFLLEVSAFLLPSPFFWLLLSLFWPPSLPFSPPSYFCQEGSLFTDIHHHISYDMYLSSHTRGIPKKSGPSDQFRTYSGPLLALRSGSGPSPEFRTLSVPLQLVPKHCFYRYLSIRRSNQKNSKTKSIHFPKVYFPKVYFPKVFFLKVYTDTV